MLVDTIVNARLSIYYSELMTIGKTLRKAKNVDNPYKKTCCPYNHILPAGKLVTSIKFSPQRIGALKFKWLKQD